MFKKGIPQWKRDQHQMRQVNSYRWCKHYDSGTGTALDKIVKPQISIAIAKAQMAQEFRAKIYARAKAGTCR